MGISYATRPFPEDVTLEYTSRGKRVRKTFDDMYAARRFYAAKLRAGADPKVVRPPDPPEVVLAPIRG
jgi:hypothetical protein